MELSAWMAAEGLTNVALAARLGVAENTVNRWRNKWRRPRQKDMTTILHMSGGQVTPNDFFIVAPPVDQGRGRPTRCEAGQ
ncbi:helix-turn-helix domain-containing protein [Roseococcus sp. YIM B11640]|uniref:helix-turn-helix domain-containing protein n=1 Tax=Roseococcus sp. YIM B11640 TaxID=3133973 RepID=UPI003C7CC36F